MSIQSAVKRQRGLCERACKFHHATPWIYQHLPLGVRIREKFLIMDIKVILASALTDPCFPLQFPPSPNHAQAHHWPSCCRTWTCVSSNRTSSNPLPPLHFPTWPVSLPDPLPALPSLQRRKLSSSSKSGVLFFSFARLVADGILHYYDSQVIPFFPVEQYTTWRQELCLVCFPAGMAPGREKAHAIILVNCTAGPSALQMCTQENTKNINRIPWVMKHNL